MATQTKVTSPIQGVEEHFGQRYFSLILVAITSLVIGLILGVFVATLATAEMENNVLGVDEADPSTFLAANPELSVAQRYTAVVMKNENSVRHSRGPSLAQYAAAVENKIDQPGTYDIEMVRHNNFVAFRNLNADPENEATSSTLLANNPELAVAGRYTGATPENEVGQPETYGQEDLRQRIYSDWVIEAEAVDVSLFARPSRGKIASP